MSQFIRPQWVASAMAIVALAAGSVSCSARTGSAPDTTSPSPLRRPSTAATTTTTLERPPDDQPDTSEKAGRRWPLPTLPEPAIDQPTQVDEPEATAAAWAQLLLTSTGDDRQDQDLRDQARQLSTDDDVLRIQLPTTQRPQAARIVAAVDMGRSEAGGVVVSVVADVGEPGGQPTVTTLTVRVERTTRWLVAGLAS